MSSIFAANIFSTAKDVV